MTPKSVLITGCSEGGIGDALAREFHAQGLRVFATARNLSKVKHLKDMGLEILRLDVTDDDSIAQAVQSVKALTGGTLDILVNNSGGGTSRQWQMPETKLIRGRIQHATSGLRHAYYQEYVRCQCLCRRHCN